MKVLRNDLEMELNLRSQLDFPKQGIEFIDITPLILQKEVLDEITTRFYYKLRDKKIDFLVLPEARGFLFGSAIAERLKCGILPVRKKGKLPPNFVEKTFESEKEYGKDILELPKLMNDNYTNKNFYVLDDIYATGNTIKSVIEAISDLGGNVIGAGCVVNIPALNSDNFIDSLIDVAEDN